MIAVRFSATMCDSIEYSMQLSVIAVKYSVTKCDSIQIFYANKCCSNKMIYANECHRSKILISLCKVSVITVL